MDSMEKMLKALLVLLVALGLFYHFEEKRQTQQQAKAEAEKQDSVIVYMIPGADNTRDIMWLNTVYVAHYNRLEDRWEWKAADSNKRRINEVDTMGRIRYRYRPGMLFSP